MSLWNAIGQNSGVLKTRVAVGAGLNNLRNQANRMGTIHGTFNGPINPNFMGPMNTGAVSGGRRRMAGMARGYAGITNRQIYGSAAVGGLLGGGYMAGRSGNNY